MLETPPLAATAPASVGGSKEAMPMQPARPVPADGRDTQPADRSRLVAQIDRLRATCRRQALALDKQGDVIALLRTGGRALKAENADLRSENARLRDARATPELAGKARTELG